MFTKALAAKLAVCAEYAWDAMTNEDRDDEAVWATMVLAGEMDHIAVLPPAERYCDALGAKAREGAGHPDTVQEAAAGQGDHRSGRWALLRHHWSEHGQGCATRGQRLGGPPPS